MTVVDSLPICEGKITRSRVKSGKLEESILDFFIVCESFLPFVTKMIVDEEKKHILTNYKAIKTKGKTVNSDHAVQYMDLALKVFLEKPKRVEVLNDNFKYCLHRIPNGTNPQCGIWLRSLLFRDSSSPLPLLLCPCGASLLDAHV